LSFSIQKLLSFKLRVSRTCRVLLQRLTLGKSKNSIFRIVLLSSVIELFRNKKVRNVTRLRKKNFQSLSMI